MGRIHESARRSTCKPRCCETATWETAVVGNGVKSLQVCGIAYVLGETRVSVCFHPTFRIEYRMVVMDSV